MNLPCFDRDFDVAILPQDTGQKRGKGVLCNRHLDDEVYNAV